MADQQEVVQRKGREGGRWINERPTSEEFSQWFQTSMKIDDALNVEDYIGGIVLIPAVEAKAKYVSGFNNKGEPIINTREEMSYVPYAKVETRIAYFWDYIAAHEELVAVVEHVESPRLPLLTPLEEVVEVIAEAETGEEKPITTRKMQQAGGLAQMVHQLPPGFSVMSVPVGQGYSHYLCCTIRVAIWERENFGKEHAVPLRTGRGTKQVPLNKSNFSGDRVWADDASLMKAETGALGRALGFAGIFVIPGSGVATAEDMLEALSQDRTPTEAPPAGQAGPSAPDTPPARTGAEEAEETDTELRKRAAEIYKLLSEEAPARAEEFGQWMRRRRLANLKDAKGAVLKGVVKKLEKLQQEHEEIAQQAPTPEEEPDAPAAETAAGDSGAEAS